MEHSILVAYATKHGSTQEVAAWVADTLRAHDLDVELRPADEVESLGPYAGVVLGGALYMGRLHGDGRAFLRQHRRELSRRPVAVFALGPGTLDADAVAGSRKQLGAALAKTPEVEPFEVAIFGGVVDPARLHFPLNRMPAADARDWSAIEDWATAVSDRFLYGKPAVDAGDRRRELQRSPR